MNQPAPAQFEYSGVENLEAMKHAQNYNRFLIELIQRHISGTQVLDFGAGAGTFAGPVRAGDIAVSCVEPDPALRATLVSDGFASYADLDEVPVASMDSIYTLNVLEHIADDGGTLSALRVRLRGGGRIVVYVPAFNVLYSAMDKLVGHHRRYRRPDLVGKLETAGFRVDVAKYVDSLGFFAALAYRFVGGDSGVINSRSVRLYDRWLFPASRLLDRVISGALGKNLLVVATRVD